MTIKHIEKQGLTPKEKARLLTLLYKYQAWLSVPAANDTDDCDDEVEEVQNTINSVQYYA